VGALLHAFECGGTAEGKYLRDVEPIVGNNIQMSSTVYNCKRMHARFTSMLRGCRNASGAALRASLADDKSVVAQNVPRLDLDVEQGFRADPPRGCGK